MVSATLSRNLSMTDLPRYRLDREMRSLGRWAWSWIIFVSAVNSDAKHTAYRTLTKRKMKSTTAEFFLEIRYRRYGLPGIYKLLVITKR
jgi:hypothetical protein